MRPRTPFLAATVAIAMGLAACGGGDPSTEAGPAAVLEVLEEGVEVAPQAAEAHPGEDGEPLDLGTRLTTDATGFGQVDHQDGSTTRIDVNTSLVVVELSTAAVAHDIEVELEDGRVWSRVPPGAETTYRVQTPVGTAAVRGTAFNVACINLAADGCTFQVFEGAVEVTTTSGAQVVLGAGQQVVVAPDGTPGEVEPIGPATFDDSFISANIQRDEDDGFPALGPDVDSDGDGDDQGGLALPPSQPPTDSNGDAIEPGTVVAVDADTGQYAVVHQDGRVAPLDTGLTGTGSPRWSPSGELIVFHADAPNGTSDVWVIRPDGTGLTALTDTADEYEQEPAWSGDGNDVVFKLGSRVGRLDLATGATTEVWGGSTFVGGLDWAWTGAQLIALGTGDVVHWVDAVGTEQHTWNEGGGGSAGWIRWLPDGFGLYVETNSADASQQVGRVVEPGGGNPIPVTSSWIRADWLDQQRYVFRRDRTLHLGQLGGGESPFGPASFNSPDAWVPPQA